ncbi:MAG: ROK family protein [Dehalococcoidia bacterium]|nr:MAG: ROK family protein [Dehalococcoidia bacterium]
MKKTQLVVDLGGTKISSAILINHRIIARDNRPTLAHEGVNSVITRLIASIEDLIEKVELDLARIEGICIASAGIIDMNEGIVTVSPNLPGWYNVPLRYKIDHHFGIKTYLINDASAAVLGEYTFGAGKKYSNVIYVTVSTGIGGGIIIGGHLYLGSSGSAGEIGHMTVKTNGPLCYCRNRGCLETLASGTAIAKEAISSVKKGKVTSLVEMVGGQVDSITAKEVSIAAQNGDELARRIISKAATYLGIGMANVINILNPEIIIIGGSVSKIGDLLFKPVKQQVLKLAFKLPAQKVRIVTSGLGDDAGLIGGALFTRQRNESIRSISSS